MQVNTKDFNQNCFISEYMYMEWNDTQTSLCLTSKHKNNTKHKNKYYFLLNTWLFTTKIRKTQSMLQSYSRTFLTQLNFNWSRNLQQLKKK